MGLTDQRQRAKNSTDYWQNEEMSRECPDLLLGSVSPDVTTLNADLVNCRILCLQITQAPGSFFPGSRGGSFLEDRAACVIRELKHARFWEADGQLEENISLPKTVLSPTFFCYVSLMKKRYLVFWMWLCEGKLKVKRTHLRLPFVSQKHACLSSLL